MAFPSRHLFSFNARLSATGRLFGALVAILLAACSSEKEANEAQTPEPAVDSAVAKNIYQRSDKAVAYIRSLHEALAARGVELAIVGMPYWSNLYADPEAEREEIRDTPDLVTLAAWTGFHRLSLAGIPTLDLYPDFHGTSLAEDIWEEDRWHLTNEGSWTLGEVVAARIGDAAMFDSGEMPKVVMMGECFALQFGKVAKARDRVNGRLEILRAYGDRGRVPNLLFAFPDAYIEGVKRVVWLVPYEMLSQDDFPPLVTEPAATPETEEADLFVQVKEGMGISNSKFNQMVEDLPYPNTVSEFRCKVVGGDREDLYGKEVTLVGYTSLEKERVGLEHAEKGAVLRVRAVDYDGKLRELPAIGKEYVVRTEEDFSLPRWWINEWSRLTTPMSTLSKEMKSRLDRE